MLRGNRGMQSRQRYGGYQEKRGQCDRNGIERLVASLSTHCKDPATQDSRIYVGNICKQKVTRGDLYIRFSQYGAISAISTLTSRSTDDTCNFAFIQFTCEEHAQQAVEQEDSAFLHGSRLDVKLAEFKLPKQPSGSTSTPVTVTFPSGKPGQKKRLTSGGLFSNGQGQSTVVKRAPASAAAYAPSGPKRTKLDQEKPPVVPDILVCGTCHKTFESMETMIQHKKKPCKPRISCRCADENVPDKVTCAVCYSDFSTPWKLIEHIHNTHNIMICSNINVVNAGPASEPVAQRDGDTVGLETGEDVLDLDNDLMDEDS